MAAAEGSILAVERRILVPDEYAASAKDILKQLDTTPEPPVEGDWDSESEET